MIDCDVFTTVYCPVPVSETFCGLPPPVSAKLTLAVNAPLSVGVKTTFTVQLAPAANVEGLIGQLLVCEKLETRAPVIPIFVIVTAAVPTLVTVTGCGELEVPTV